MIYIVKCTIFWHFFHFELWWLAISTPAKVGKSYTPQKKALLPIVWKKFWNRKNFLMEGFTLILLKVKLFHLRGHGHPQGGATPSFSTDSKSCILGLSNEVSFVSRFLWKRFENQEKEKSIIWQNVSNWRTLYNHRLV